MMLSRTQKLAYLSAFLVVLTTGLVHGLWTGRWADDHDLQDAAARLARLPLELGDWRGDALVVDAATLTRAEVAGYIFRRYTHRTTGQSVNMILLCGRFGPLSVHTPDVCFGGAGYLTMDPAHQISVVPHEGGQPAELWTARFERKTGPTSTYLRSFWSWSTGRTWRAPEYPRFAFRTAPVLYKMYVTRDMARPEEPLDSDPGQVFLRCLLPELTIALADS